MHSTTWRLGHRPGLDALRGVAVLLVVAGHTFWRHYMPAGRIGVSVFFALSGFLITALLLEENGREGRMDLRAFYLRRARRLLPGVVFFLAVMLLFGALFGRAFATPGEVWPALLYVENVVRIGGVHTGSVGHTWSLSIEEQFYLVWPLLLVRLLRWRPMAVLPVAVTAAACSVAVRVALVLVGASADRIYFGTDTNACMLLLGCAAAAWIVQRGPVRVPRPVLWVALAVIVLLGVEPLVAGWIVFVPPLVGCLAVVAILAAVDGRGVPAPAWLQLVGRRSYGLYLWHYPLVGTILPVLPGSRIVTVPIVLGLSWGLTFLSWRYVEEPFMRRRSLVAAGDAAGLERRVVAAA